MIDYEALATIGVYGFEIHFRVKHYNMYFQSFFNEGIVTAVTEKDAIEVGRFLAEEAHKLEYDYTIMVYEKFMRKWIAGWDSSKARVANPNHRVFIWMGGRDCDGFDWCNYVSFEGLREATEYVEDSLEHADGPTGYFTMSRDDWEQGDYPEYRDRFAEAMGY